MQWFLSLNEEDQEFIKQFVMASGSLKQLAKVYRISYPTLRMRLDKTIQKINLLEKEKINSFEAKIMQFVIDDKLSLELAKELMNTYKEEKNE